MIPGGLSRRQLFAAGSVALLGGCFDSPIVTKLPDAIRFAVLGVPDVPLQRAAIAKLPYATISAKIGRGPRSLLVLARIEHSNLHFLSADRVALVLRKGRLVRTAGLPESVRETRSAGADPVAGLHVLSGVGEHVRYLDLEPGGRYGVPVLSTYERLGPEKITVLEIEFDTIRVRERNRALTLRWHFENEFWVDPADGFVWRSRQHMTRGLPAAEIDILKPAQIAPA